MLTGVTTKPAIGTLLQAQVGPDRFPLAQMARLDPRNAAAETLAAYLRQAVFLIPGPPDTQFLLNEVRTEWPEDFEQLNQPAAAITTQTELLDPHNLAPSPLEDTRDVFCPGTILWKTDELALRFQVDFWCTSKPERTAIAAALPALFSPTETRAGILLQGSPDYYDLPVRYTLVQSARVDTSATTFTRDREVRAFVRAEIDVVHLRKYVELDPQLFLNEDPIGGQAGE